MGFIVSLAVGSVLEWLILMFVIPFAQRLADFSMPPPLEMAKKLLVLVLLKNLVGFGVATVLGGTFLASIAAAIVFWTGLVKLFDLDAFGAVIIVVASWLVRSFILAGILGLIFGL